MYSVLDIYVHAVVSIVMRLVYIHARRQAYMHCVLGCLQELDVLTACVLTG